MKKLLILVLILCITSIVNAGPLIFTVYGEPQPSKILMYPSQTIEIGLELAAGNTILGYTIDWKLSNADAEFLTGNVRFPMHFEFPSTRTYVHPQLFEATGSQFLGAPIPGPGVIMEGLLIHLSRPPMRGVILQVIAQAGTIINDVEIPEGTVLHTLEIGVPEPMTLTLLGLGGLFLARRKK